MRTLIVLVVGLMVAGCDTALTMKSVAGEYELKKDGDTYKYVFLENGNTEFYVNGNLLGRRDWNRWKIIDGKKQDINRLVITKHNGKTAESFRINPDRSITYVERGEELIFKKIK